MKTTALYEKHLALNAKMIEYAGFSMPLSYSDISEEHISVRIGMGIFDVSHMGEFLIEGKEALKFVNHLITNFVPEDYQKVTYSLMCDEKGFVIDDLLVYVLKPEQILLVVNAGNIDKDFAWIVQQAVGFDVQPKNVSEFYSQVAIQGPNTAENMIKIVGLDVTDLKFMTYKMIPFGQGFIICSRTGYTGEDGFEIYGARKFVTQIWDNALEVRAVPCGLGARDTLRFEGNLPLYTHEISDSINPLEAGLGFAVKLEKEFIGRDALLFAKEHPTRKIVGLEMLEKSIPRHGYEVYHQDELVGTITTGYLLPKVNIPVAYAIIDIKYAALGTELFVLIRKNKVPAKVRNRKFYTKNYRK